MFFVAIIFVVLRLSFHVDGSDQIGIPPISPVDKDPDVYLDMTEIVESKGFPIEKHFVTTSVVTVCHTNVLAISEIHVFYRMDTFSQCFEYQPTLKDSHERLLFCSMGYWTVLLLGSIT